jgi:hypothetical protein
MTKKITIFFLFIALSVVGRAQADTLFRALRTITGDIVGFTVDNLDNIYLISSTNQVKKLNANGDSVAVFNNVKKYGQATLIDVSNPLKVLLYYRDFGTIVVLDRFLSVRNTIDLRRQNILQVKAIGQSYDNKIWVYDELENKLKKIDEDGSVLGETPDFRQLFDPAPSPQGIFDEDQFVYLYDSSMGVYAFDYYGALKNKIPINHWNNFKVSGKYVYGSNAGNLYRYSIRTLLTEEWKLPAELLHAHSFNFTSTRLYALRKDRVDIYNFH